ncbi:Aste57867_16789 [Aphanomyces stellatus]|uniref:Aste57867_16789 protein n=1 Tax=Aphanomyces stellatus TaxID=120398 RepID=A0A485L852_9STRA|nr:hypothetical protein As57867_016732 [Aphanomyces stellatus]VFT93554.1 Aste57867_16789 [Aphanomyces stellatus]
MINLSFPQVIFVPSMLIVLGAVTLLNFKNLFLAITQYATKYSSNEIVKTIKPGTCVGFTAVESTVSLMFACVALVYIKNFLEAVLGKASSFTFKLEHILLVAIIFALFAVANEIAVGNELKEKEIKLLRAQAKATNEKKDDKKKD